MSRLTFSIFLFITVYSKNICLSMSSIDQTVRQVSLYYTNVSSLTILSVDDNISKIYQNMTKIGNYKIQLQQKYRFQVTPSIFFNETMQNYNNINFSFQNQTNSTQGFNAFKNIWIKFPVGIVTISCSLAWRVKINCGTFVQVHFPFNKKVLIKQRVDDLEAIINLPIQELCAGPYHVWLIYSTRVGEVIKAVIPIFIAYPFCSC